MGKPSSAMSVASRNHFIAWARDEASVLRSSWTRRQLAAACYPNSRAFGGFDTSTSRTSVILYLENYMFAKRFVHHTARVGRDQSPNAASGMKVKPDATHGGRLIRSFDPVSDRR
jgi:hypothetical protein